MKNIYNMKLNEEYIYRRVDGQLALHITRVPGGWIYFQYDKSCDIGSSSFVPYDNEFSDYNWELPIKQT